MTRIDSLSQRPDRAGRYLVKLSDGSTLRLYRQSVEEFGIRPGLELTEEGLERLRESAGAVSAKMRAVRIVSASNVSREDLEKRLIQKGEDPDQARAAVEWMGQMNLVDDRATAKQIVSHCAARGYGEARAKQALYEKRIPRQYWEEALRDYPDQEEAIVSFLRSRLGTDPGEKERRRAADALIRRGFCWEQIRRGLRKLDAEYQED